MSEEIIDIVDHKDNVRCSLPRSFIYENNLTVFMRSVWLVIKNKAGQLLIAKRAQDKSHLPGALDGAAVGCVSAGEDYWPAMVRETQEELGINLEEYNVKTVKKFEPHKDDSFCFFMVYELELEQIPKTYNPEDIETLEWMHPDEIIALAEQGVSMKSMLPVIARMYKKDNA